MADTYVNICDLYAHTISELANNTQTWLEFLAASGRNYKLTFDEQVLVFAQRPDATAVLEFEKWNKVFGRWVNKGARGIAVFGKPGTHALRYYFDVSDTTASQYARQLPIWQMHPEYASDIANMLKTTFNTERSIRGLKHVIDEVVKSLFEDNQDDYFQELIATQNLTGSEKDKLSSIFNHLLKSSVAYVIASRLGYNIEADISDDLALFKTPETMNTLGCAVSDIAKVVLREVARDVFKLEAIERDSKRSIARLDTELDNPVQSSLTTRSGDADILRNNRQNTATTAKVDRKRNPNARPVRSDAPHLPIESSARSLYQPTQYRQTEPTSFRDGQTGIRHDGDNHFPNDKKAPHRRGNEEKRPDVLDKTHEQHQRKRERNRSPRPDLQLAPTEQIQFIHEAAEKSTASQVSVAKASSITLGSRAQFGKKQFGVLSSRDDKMALFDGTSSLFPKDMSRKKTAGKKLENPLHEKLPHKNRALDKQTADTQTSFNLSENYVIPHDFSEDASLRNRLENNLKALRTVREIEAENRQASAQEQNVLSRYAGWGSLAKVFDEKDGSWKGQKHALKELLSEEQYRAARASTLTAYYTPAIVVNAMYSFLSNVGFSSGNILEPACGIGNFFGRLPESMKEASLFGAELDPTTAKIAHYLYPKADIRISGFEDAEFPDNFFDVAIGNVPFGSYSVADDRFANRNFLIHDYFFARSLELIRPGGIIAFITSKGTLDKKNPQTRRYLAQRAELLGAIRLPNTAFEDCAGTRVTADIIFLQKRERAIVDEPDWVHLGLTKDKIAVNSYFAEHPDMILGKMRHEVASLYGKAQTTCVPFESEELDELLRGAITNIHARISEYERPDEIDEGFLAADPEVKNYSFTIINNAVYYRIDSKMFLSKLTRTAEDRVRGMISIRNSVKELIYAQTNNDYDDEINRYQSQLNRIYDKFTLKYGILNSRANARVFSQDSSYYLLCALEILDDEHNFIAKADMFNKRTIRPNTSVIGANTSSEALAASLCEKGKVDLNYMSTLLNKSGQEILQDLDGVIFHNPLLKCYQTADEYLSGNVRQKLSIAQKAAQKDDVYRANVKALKRVLPADLTANEISVRLGATWIPASDIESFMYELLETPLWKRDGIRVRYSSISAQWNISGKSRDNSNVRAVASFGTKRANAYRILEDTLNLRDVRVFDYVEDSDNKRLAVLNKKETAIALSKQDAIKQAFKNWIFNDPERRVRLMRSYNDMFNSWRLRSFDGSHLTFPGMNPGIEFRPHQKNSVARILYGHNTLLGHCVGAGKTYVMCAAAQELKRIGLAHKSLIVVPNHLTEQWASEYLTLYPAANILVSTKRDFEKKNRQRFCARIATGDYDAVIIGQTQFEKIPVSLERQKEMIKREIEKITKGIEEIKTQREERYSIKQMEASRKKLEVRLKKLNDQKRKDDVIEFEQLGIDRLFVDESHYYKNLFFYTKMRNVAGIAQGEALKSSDLFMKCRYLDEITENKGIVFATGTPLSNSMAELYTIQRYLQYEELSKLGLLHFDCWASTFGDTTTSLELAPEGSGYRQKTRFARFYNLPELMTLFRQVADIQTAEMLNLPVPKLNYHNVSVTPSEFQAELVQELSERADRVRMRMVNPTEDNMLLITNDGRKLALDQRLINSNLPDNPSGKTAACAENVFKIWEEYKEARLTQLVFCDLSTPKQGTNFSVYHDLREKLTSRGIPENEIAFIHDYHSEAKKAEIFAKMRSGQVRVLLGSTQKMGAGTNVQTRLIALHDLDCPWRPSDLQQRLGRIERQGNSNNEVEVFRYVTESTFDAYLYQLVESKQKFIGQIMTSKSPVRSATDVDETALSYAELKALATGNPLIKERMDLEMKVSRLKLLKSDHLSQKYACEDKLAQVYPQKIAALTARIKGLEADVITAKQNPPAKKETFQIVINNTIYTDKTHAGCAVLNIAKTLSSPKFVQFATYRGFSLKLGFNSITRYFEVKTVGRLEHVAVLGSDGAGTILRIDNAIGKIEQTLEKTKQRLTDNERQVENTKTEIAKPFDNEDELQEATKRLKELDRALRMDKSDTPELLDEQVRPKKKRLVTRQR